MVNDGTFCKFNLTLLEEFCFILLLLYLSLPYSERLPLKNLILFIICIERQIWNVFYFLFWTRLHSHTLLWYSAFKIQTKVKCQMSIPICDGHQLFSLFSFVLQLQHFPFSLHTFVKYSFHESHVWLCQIVFVLLVFTKKLYFGFCRFWQEIERLPCHAKVLSLLLKL